MRNVLIAISFMLLISGCGSSYSLQRDTLSIDDKVPLVKAQVDNPYPICKPFDSKIRVADLSKTRKMRVYLQGEVLCQLKD
ncbi:hypothetical protein [Shewanella sp. Iso12]|uniref:hypothetical protein n=1 Tax=Shewanella sp. Iso12 TaxID=1826753 RepID=UPI00142F73DF|nr:hypothetical protein [Shewanella sp. Iso12]NJI86975.1 hypothetical protein [Shewanella sp. Iso12]